MIHNSQQRIGLNDSLQSSIMKLVEGNPGAISVLAQAFKRSPTIDPIGAFGGLGPILACDAHGLYGSKIWILYKDICGERIDAFLAMLRACQMGVAGTNDPEHIRAEEVDDIWDKLCDRLPSFGKREVAVNAK